MENFDIGICWQVISLILIGRQLTLDIVGAACLKSTRLVIGLLLPSLSSSLPPAPFYQMEDDQPHPVELSRADDILRASAASPIVVALTSASENAGQKRKMADLEDRDNLTSGHALKRCGPFCYV